MLKPFLVLTDATAHKFELVISKLGNVQLSLTFANLRSLDDEDNIRLLPLPIATRTHTVTSTPSINAHSSREK